MDTLLAFVPMLIILPIVLLFWGLCIYVLILIIKALKIYINKNS